MIVDGLYTGTERSYFRSHIGHDTLVSDMSYWYRLLDYYRVVRPSWEDETFVTNTIDDISTFIMICHENG